MCICGIRTDESDNWALVDNIPTPPYPYQNSSKPLMPLRFKKWRSMRFLHLSRLAVRAILVQMEVKCTVERYVAGDSAAQLARDLDSRHNREKLSHSVAS